MKKIFNAFLLAPLIFTLNSCSSSSWSDLFSDADSEERNQELMEDFGAEGEVLEKFSERKETEQEPKEEPKKEPIKKVVITTSSEKAGKDVVVAKGTSPKTKVVTLKPTKEKEKPLKKSKETAAKEQAEKPRFPDDYPEQIQAINSKVGKLWKRYDPIFFPGETIVMDINYMGISTGKIVLTTEEETVIGDKKVYHAKARLKTSDYYSYLYELDDNIDSYISVDTLTPVKFSLIQRESGQDVDDLQLFDLEKLKTYSFYKRVTDDKTKKKKEEKYTPIKYTDPLGVIWFLRGLPMKKGMVFHVPIMNRGKIIMLKAKNDGLETIDTGLGKKKAYRMTASTAYSGETLKSGDMTFWFSADERRVFLKFKAKIKIGSISGDIEKYSK